MNLKAAQALADDVLVVLLLRRLARHLLRCVQSM